MLSSSRTLPFVRWALSLPLLVFALLLTELVEPFFGDLYVLRLSLRGPFLKAVQDVDNILNLFQIEHAIPCAFVLLPQFVDSRTNRPHWLAVRRHLAELHAIQRITQVLLCPGWKGSQCISGIADPHNL